MACCLHCHEGHDLIELYTKRNFRCDCGNTKFTDFKCKLDDTKSDVNILNSYNQNFMGVYCTCKRPYPDEEDTVNDVMIQCIFCEDWYHTRHLGIEIPSNSYAEMVCEGCIRQHDFLLHYDGLALKKVTPETVETTVEVNGSSASKDDSEVKSSIASEVDVSVTEEKADEFTSIIDKSQEIKLAAITDCKMPKYKSQDICAKFWPDVTWRQQLCTCVKCLKLYENEKVMFLIDPQDTVQVYEEKGTARALEDEHSLQEKFLNSLDRVPLMETIAAYNELKGELGEFLKKFAENKKVVREEDVKEFFAGMKARKRRKMDSVPHFCR